MTDYLANNQPVSAEQFTRHACDPRTSVVVEACAGSGKTWLLVSRIVRALLAGASPGEILAITFTRRAAQEMQSRLLADLKTLAAADDIALIEFLQLRGLTAAQAHEAQDRARGLYERVVTAPVSLTLETFHGWFWQLVSRAPLGAGVPFAPVLVESTDRLRRDAWLHFSAALLRPAHAAQRAAWETLIDLVGDSSARKLTEQLLDKRAEWWSFAAGDEQGAVERALAPLSVAGDTDPALRVREPECVNTLHSVLDLLLSIAKPNKTTAGKIVELQHWLQGPAAEPGSDLHAACDLLLTKTHTPRELFTPEKLGKHLSSETHVQRYAQAHAWLINYLTQLQSARRTWRAWQINQAALACGRLLIEHYQRLKDQQQALDFTDLEWHAYRLLADPDSAAYMQARLDARYRHILLDEFQDTNPLQWQVLQSWLAAYGELDEADGQANRPSVFIVGDPKQSIYRFRRAEPRVFDAACALLQRDFGAVHLRTNVTRRNSTRVVEALNVVMSGTNALYQPQSTRAAAVGEFVLLPLVPPPEKGDLLPPLQGGEGGNSQSTALRHRSDMRVQAHGCATGGDGLKSVAPIQPIPSLTLPLKGRELNSALPLKGREVQAGIDLRDVLTTPRTQRDNDNRYREGRVIANEIAQALTTVRIHEQGAARWSDVLLLVRRRTHLMDYERALRDAGVPFVSDRRGGLLTTLEADDLTALLSFLTTPMADLPLAHALRSPLFGCCDADLIHLVQQPGHSGWQRLQHVAKSEEPASTLLHAHELLARWLNLAGVLPVHDLLDRIYFEGDVRRRYAAVAPPALHAQVQANLDAFIELALALDAGRYPSLPRFIDELTHLKQHARDEAPDEGAAHVTDAVRILTIHAAKGLEADIVVLADTHAVARPDDESTLVVWPPHAPAPEHLSLVARGADALDAARAPWFAQEDAQRAQEDWNLLYVAATRARQVLIVSGVAPAKGALIDTWYTRMQAAQALSAGAAPALATSMARTATQRQVYDFMPEPQPVGQRGAPAPDSPAQRLGRAWHALLELGLDADTTTLARRHGLTAEQLQQAAAAAQHVRAQLPQFFSTAAQAEVEVMSAAGELLRLDRLIETPEARWIIDFKWSVSPELRADYEAQVRRYGAVVSDLYPDKPVRLGLVDARGALMEVIPGELNRLPSPSVPLPEGEGS